MNPWNKATRTMALREMKGRASLRAKQVDSGKGKEIVED